MLALMSTVIEPVSLTRCHEYDILMGLYHPLMAASTSKVNELLPGYLRGKLARGINPSFQPVISKQNKSGLQIRDLLQENFGFTLDTKYFLKFQNIVYIKTFKLK